MKPSFSDRIGITKLPSILQTDGMTKKLRSSLWNFVLNTFLERYSYSAIVQPIAEYFFRVPLDSLPRFNIDQKKWLRDIFFDKNFKWWEVYNLIEFLVERCRHVHYDLKSETLCAKVNHILEREYSGYRFVSGVLAPITSSVEVSTISEAISVASGLGLLGAQTHLKTAISLLARKPKPDFRNSIKESISAIESVCKQITGEKSGGLYKALTKLDAKVRFHSEFKSGLLSLYGYTSDEDGIRHAILQDPNVGFDEAKFMLVSCSALVHFIVMKAQKAGILK